MKKHLLWLHFVLIIVVAFSSRVEEVVRPARAVDKQISLAIFTKNNYTSPVYNEALAKVQVTVTKVKGKSKTIVWQKSFSAMPLKNYPGVNKPFMQQVTIPGVFDGKEQLVVTYFITYDSKGSVIRFQNGEVVSKGASEGSLFIAI
jgi:hypothetical protein